MWKPLISQLVGYGVFVNRLMSTTPKLAKHCLPRHPMNSQLNCSHVRRGGWLGTERNTLTDPLGLSLPPYGPPVRWTINQQNFVQVLYKPVLALRDFLSIASVDCTGIHWNKFTNLNNKGAIPLTHPVWFTLHPPIQVRAAAAIVNPLIWGLIEHENTGLFMCTYIYIYVKYLYNLYTYMKNIIIYICI